MRHGGGSPVTTFQSAASGPSAAWTRCAAGTTDRCRAVVGPSPSSRRLDTRPRSSRLAPHRRVARSGTRAPERFREAVRRDRRATRRPPIRAPHRRGCPTGGASARGRRPQCPREPSAEALPTRAAARRRATSPHHRPVRAHEDLRRESGMLDQRCPAVSRAVVHRDDERVPGKLVAAWNASSSSDESDRKPSRRSRRSCRAKRHGLRSTRSWPAFPSPARRWKTSAV